MATTTYAAGKIGYLYKVRVNQDLAPGNWPNGILVTSSKDWSDLNQKTGEDSYWHFGALIRLPKRQTYGSNHTLLDTKVFLTVNAS